MQTPARSRPKLVTLVIAPLGALLLLVGACGSPPATRTAIVSSPSSWKAEVGHRYATMTTGNIVLTGNSRGGYWRPNLNRRNNETVCIFIRSIYGQSTFTTVSALYNGAQVGGAINFSTVNGTWRRGCFSGLTAGRNYQFSYFSPSNTAVSVRVEAYQRYY